MQKNKLEGVLAFGGQFWYQSCFYHELMFATGAFGIDGRELLLQEFIYYDKNFRMNTNIMSISEMYKSMGIFFRHINVPDFETVARYIDKGSPLFIGVDNFYYSARSDFYGKEHAPHFVLVYGYDRENKTFNIIDHEYNNSYIFKEKQWDAEDILNASNKYAEGICTHKYTSLLLKKCSPKGERIYDRILASPDLLEKSAYNFQENITKLKNYLEGGEKKLSRYCKKLSAFFYIAHRKRACLAESILGEKHPEFKDMLAQISSMHAFFRAVFLKIEWWRDYSFIEKNREMLEAKADELQEAEKRFFNGVKALL